MSSTKTFLIQSTFPLDEGVETDIDSRIVIKWLTLEQIQSTLFGLHSEASHYNVVITKTTTINVVTIREMIISYPEVNFFFSDVVWYHNLLNIPKDNASRQKELLKTIYEGSNLSDGQKDELSGEYKPKIKRLLKKTKNTEEYNSILKEVKFFLDILSINIGFHSIDTISINTIKEIADRENLFDASNLRYAVKRFVFNEKKVKLNNAHILESRAQHIAYVVDEESTHCRQLSYCLYANGMRAFPISTKMLLLYAARQWKCQQDKIILRDFDLQFKDEDQGEKITREEGYNETDYIRGYKFNTITKKWEDLISDCSPDDCGISCKYNHPYWHKKDLPYSYCVSQGYDQLYINNKKVHVWKISKSKRKLNVPGVEKPVSGIYKELTDNIKPIRECYEQKFADYGIDLTRINRSHSTPLGLYDIALNIIKRAEHYLEERKFIRAAVLSQEAIEILNGYHTSLFLQSYHIHAQAENAIAMNMLGSDESSLAKDCEMRVDIIRHDIARMLRSTTFDKKNILNQIYADCRLYCKEKEHFKSEEVFIDAMAKLNDGAPISRLWGKISKE